MAKTKSTIETEEEIRLSCLFISAAEKPYFGPMHDKMENRGYDPDELTESELVDAYDTLNRFLSFC